MKTTRQLFLRVNSELFFLFIFYFVHGQVRSVKSQDQTLKNKYNRIADFLYKSLACIGLFLPMPM